MGRHSSIDTSLFRSVDDNNHDDDYDDDDGDGDGDGEGDGDGDGYEGVLGRGYPLSHYDCCVSCMCCVNCVSCNEFPLMMLRFRVTTVTLWRIENVGCGPAVAHHHRASFDPDNDFNGNSIDPDNGDKKNSIDLNNDDPEYCFDLDPDYI